MIELRRRDTTRHPPSGWLAWIRSKRSGTRAEAQGDCAPRPTRVWSRLFKRGPASGRQSARELRDPMLHFVRDWVLALGGKPIIEAPDLIHTQMPDGQKASYSSSPRRADHEHALQIIAPGFPARDALLTEAMRLGAGLTLRLPSGQRNAVDLARAAIATTPDTRMLAPDDAHSPLLDTRDGGRQAGVRYVVAGSGKLRSCTVVGESQRVVHEFAMRVTVSSRTGKRREMVRIALDASTGMRIAPLDDLQPQLASATRIEQVSIQPDGHHLQQAIDMLAPVVQAAGRLERARSLPAFERQCSDLNSTFQHALIETPERAPALVRAHAQESAHLTEVYAVDVVTELVNVVTLVSTVASVSVRFAHGGSMTIPVDMSRGTVDTPRCAACGTNWSSGAACAKGHITCLDCQQTCTHCGLRQCDQCSLPPLAACPTCGASICARCVTTGAKRRMRHPRQPEAGSVSLQPAIMRQSPATDPHSHLLEAGSAAVLPKWSGMSAIASTGPNDLCPADLDAMSPATWDTMLRWLVEGLDWRLDPPIEPPAARVTAPVSAAEMILSCMVAQPSSESDALGGLRSGNRVVVSSYRAGISSGTLSTALESLRAAATLLPGTTAVLVTTESTTAPSPRAKSGGQAVLVIGRTELARLVNALAHAHGIARTAEDEVTQRCAEAALAVRNELISGLTQCRETLANGGQSTTKMTAVLATSSASHPSGEGDDLNTVAVGSLTTTQQALAALETLIEEWEQAFAITPTRDNTLAINVDEATFERMRGRSGHLLQVLEDGCFELSGIAPTATLASIWIAAMQERIERHCASLALRCEALNPAAWRVFYDVRDQSVAAASVSAMAASARAALRARKLEEELKLHEERKRAGRV